MPQVFPFKLNPEGHYGSSSFPSRALTCTVPHGSNFSWCYSTSLWNPWELVTWYRLKCQQYADNIQVYISFIIKCKQHHIRGHSSYRQATKLPRATDMTRWPFHCDTSFCNHLTCPQMFNLVHSHGVLSNILVLLHNQIAMTAKNTLFLAMTGQEIDPMHWGTDRSEWSMHLLSPHLSIANHSLKQGHTLWKCTILYKMQEPACLITQVTGKTWPWFTCPWIQGLYSYTRSCSRSVCPDIHSFLWDWPMISERAPFPPW